MTHELCVVIGAGSGVDFSMPMGEELKGSIAKAFLRRSDNLGRARWDDDELRRAVCGTQAQAKSRCDGEQLTRAAERIRNGMALAPSIDEFIEANRGDKAIEHAAKAAIVWSIVRAERKSQLYVDPSNLYNRLTIDKLQQTWLVRFFRLIVGRAQASTIIERFKAITIVNFNYDRCIEHYVFWALRIYWEMTEAEAANAVAALEIFHPYGAIAPLPWENPQGHLSFGAELGSRELLEMTGSIKTFTESIDPQSSQIIAIRQALEESPKLLFLGFAFHQINMELLGGDQPNTVKVNKRVWGSAFNISDYNRLVLKTRVAAVAGAEPEKIELLRGSCLETLEEYWLQLLF